MEIVQTNNRLSVNTPCQTKTIIARMANVRTVTPDGSNVRASQDQQSPHIVRELLQLQGARHLLEVQDPLGGAWTNLLRDLQAQGQSRS